MHTKKTNNTNKLIQISYHSILTKIQKLQNFKKKKKKKLFSVPAGTVGIARNWPVRCRYGRYFFRYKTEGSNVPDCWPVRYILAVPAGTIRNRQPWSNLNCNRSLSEKYCFNLVSLNLLLFSSFSFSFSHFFHSLV